MNAQKRGGEHKIMNDGKKIHFKIDKASFEINEDQNPVTGAYLRGLPPVAADYDLWLRARGNEDDRIITPEETITIENGFHFYTSKQTVTPGGDQK